MKQAGYSGVGLALCAMGMAVLLGCDSSDSDSSTVAPAETFAISPQSVTLTASNMSSQTFTASGGYPGYTWEVEDASLGTLNMTVGVNVKYTASTNTGDNIITANDASNNVSTAVVTQI